MRENARFLTPSEMTFTSDVLPRHPISSNLVPRTSNLAYPRSSYLDPPQSHLAALCPSWMASKILLGLLQSPTTWTSSQLWAKVSRRVRSGANPVARHMVDMKPVPFTRLADRRQLVAFDRFKPQAHAELHAEPGQLVQECRAQHQRDARARIARPCRSGSPSSLPGRATRPPRHPRGRRRRPRHSSPLPCRRSRRSHTPTTIGLSLPWISGRTEYRPRPGSGHRTFLGQSSQGLPLP